MAWITPAPGARLDVPGRGRAHPAIARATAAHASARVGARESGRESGRAGWAWRPEARTLARARDDSALPSRPPPRPGSATGSSAVLSTLAVAAQTRITPSLFAQSNSDTKRRKGHCKPAADSVVV